MKNIILIGMPGSGKSTLGVLLAKALGMDFIDTDILIQQQENNLLQTIIDTQGIETFLQIEEAVISNLKTEDCIIATGGSAVYSPKAMNALKENGTVVYLHATYMEVKKRITNITTRGIVVKSGNTLKSAYDERLPLYEKYGDIVIDCSDKDVESCIAEIMETLRHISLTPERR